MPGWTLLKVDTLDRAILQTQASRGSAKCAEDTSQRYWSLKWREQSGLHDISCVVVQPRGPGISGLWTAVLLVPSHLQVEESG